MKVRFVTTAAGPLGVYAAGSTATVSPSWAGALLSGGFAVVVADDEPAVVVHAEIESMAIEQPETAMLRPARRRGR